MRKRHVFLFIVLILMTFLVPSCHKTSEEIPESEQELPDMILRNASYTYGQPGRKPVLMEAEKITIWKDSKKTQLENVSFTQKSDKTDDIELTGSCDMAISYNNEKVTLTGNVKLYKTTDEVTIECDDLSWDDNTGEMHSNGTVMLSYQGGTTIKATGFTAKLNENVYTFDKLDGGSYSVSEQESEEVAVNEEI